MDQVEKLKAEVYDLTKMVQDRDAVIAEILRLTGKKSVKELIDSLTKKPAN